MKKRLIIIASIVVALVLVAALAIPLMLDPEHHRARIESLLKESTGWDAQLGAIDLSILRGLKLEVSPASLRAPEDSSTIEFEKLVIKARFWPLLRGELEVSRVDLLTPRIRIVRRNLEEGWVLPVPNQAGSDSPAPSATPPAGSTTPAPETQDASPAVRVETIRILDGSIAIDDRSGAAPLSVGLEGLSLDLNGESLEFTGSGRLAGDLGEIEFSGRPGGEIRIGLSQVKTDLLAQVAGEDLVHRGGTISGEIRAAGSGVFTGELTFDQLSLLAGTQAIDRAQASFRIEGKADAWRMEELELNLGDLHVRGQGSLTPDLALRLEVPESPLEAVLKVSAAVIPLPVEIRGPGTFSTTLAVDQPAGGSFSYQADGRFTAASLVAAELLPPASDLRAEFALDRGGDLAVRILEGQVADGPFRGTLRVSPVAPPGEMQFEGGVTQAILGELLSPMMGARAAKLGGLTGLDASIRMDLNQEEITPSSLGGVIKIEGEKINLAGWDLEGAVRTGLEKKLGDLGGLVRLLGKEKTAPVAGTDARSGTDVLDSFSAQVQLDGQPWSLQGLQLRGGQIAASGDGSFDPLTGKLKLSVTALLDADKSAELVREYSSLRHLLDAKGRLSVPMAIDGPMDSPSIGVDMSGLLSGGESGGGVEGLVKGFLDRRKKKKKKK